MADYLDACRSLGDEELLGSLKRLRSHENQNLADLIAHLAEVDRRRLYLDECCASMFVFCTGRLRYSEAEAAWRIYTARIATRFPGILSFVESGLPMTSIVTLAPHLTEENHAALLERARGKSKFEVQRMIAELDPKPDARDVVRRLPEPVEAAATAPSEELALANRAPISVPLRESSSERSDVLLPTAPERVRFAFTGGEDLLGLLRRAQEVLKHKYPAGDLEPIFREALEALLDKKDPERRIRAKEEKGKMIGIDELPPNGQSNPSSRRIPVAVRDVVWRRDGGQCVFVNPDGSRCPERGGLEFDHIVPYALGGPSNNPRNLRLLCRAHNQQLARAEFGERVTRHYPAPGF